MVYNNNNIDIDIDIEKVNLLTNIDNDNVKNKYDKNKRVDLIADELVRKFAAPNSRAFYCKVAYKLPENKIWTNYEMSLRGKNPARLFTWLCKKDMS